MECNARKKLSMRCKNSITLDLVVIVSGTQSEGGATSGGECFYTQSHINSSIIDNTNHLTER